MTALLPASLRLGPVGLRVASLERSVAWYERVLGVVPRTVHEGVVALTITEGETLIRLREVPGARPVPERGRRGLYHHAVRLPSRAALGAFLRHVEQLREPFGASDHLFSEALYLQDPDGITLEVYADRPREQWHWEGDEVLGAIDPLDAQAVRAAAEGPWNGCPHGTDLGHVHFFVDDLARAERFHCAGLGFEAVTRRFRGALFVSAGRYHHHVGLNVWAATQPLAGPQDAGLDDWTIVLPDEASRAAVRDRLASIDVPCAVEGDAWTAVDPWDMTVRLCVPD